MIKEKWEKLNELKEEIRDCEVKFHALKRHERLNERNIRLGSPGCDIPAVPVPDELHDVFLDLMKDYYVCQLSDLKEEFKEG